MLTLSPMRLPQPIQEAQVLVAICDDDLSLARAEARYNYIHADTEPEAAFWFCVLMILTPGRQQA